MVIRAIKAAVVGYIKLENNAKQQWQIKQKAKITARLAVKLHRAKWF